MGFMEIRNVTGNQSLQGPPTEANDCVCSHSCGFRITIDLGQLNRGTVKAQNRLPVTLFEKKSKTSESTDVLNQNPLLANGLHRKSDQDCSTNSTTRSRYTSYYNEKMALEVDKTLQIVSPGGLLCSGVDPKILRKDINLRKKKPVVCQIEDGALLLSSFIRNKTSKSTRKSSCKTKPCKSKPPRKSKTQKGSCRLLRRSLGIGRKHNEEKWFKFGSRTVLSWLISRGTISLKEVIQCRNSKDNSVVKEGIITKNGIRCKCCNRVISVSEFKSHDGFGLNCRILNLIMGSGKSFRLCQLEAWFDEYDARKSATRPIKVEDLDQNDDSCGLCGDGGELICCDNCPSTFHRKCLCVQELPEGDWYCQHCTCHICGALVVDKGAVSSSALKCSQCDHKYHEACLKNKGLSQDVASETWFCSGSCQEVYLGLQSHVGALNSLSEGYSWILLKCIEGDQKVKPAQEFIALTSECNPKLAVALTIMEDSFQSMVDARTGIDMIPQVIYNWRSEFPRLDYHGFYTMLLEKDDVLISVASIRIHHVTVAEMPLITTHSKYRHQGMCRRLMSSIEEMLISLKVEKLVITAVHDLVETWIVSFGFEPLEDHERKSLSHFNFMVFPGTVWLKKTMYKQQAADELTRL